MPMDDVTSKLVEILREHLQFVGADEELQMTQELSELGLDSAGAIGLLLEVEGSFSVAFPDEMLVPETFRTATTLRDAIIQLKSRG